MTPSPEILDWLACKNEPTSRSAAAVIGFGHFDSRIPAVCGQLAAAGIADRILFTGGIGAGTADLGRPEAGVFHESLRLWFPSLAPDRLLIENRSTNTAENIRFLREVWENAGRSAALRQSGVILVATPVRMRRVLLTWKMLAPEIPATCHAPSTDVATETLLYMARGCALATQIANEINRLQTYPAKGWIVAPEFPACLHERPRSQQT